MRQITSYFADELDELKTNQDMDESKINLLVDSLEGGMQFYADLEKELCVSSWKQKGKGDKPAPQQAKLAYY